MHRPHNNFKLIYAMTRIIGVHKSGHENEFAFYTYFNSIFLHPRLHNFQTTGNLEMYMSFSGTSYLAWQKKNCMARQQSYLVIIFRGAILLQGKKKLAPIGAVKNCMTRQQSYLAISPRGPYFLQGEPTIVP